MDLFFREYGAGFPIVVLHGLLGSGGNWHTLSRGPFAERFRPIVVDQRNHGQSPHDDRMDYPIMAEDLDTLLDRADIPRCHLLGHSMGGKTAMQYALTHPERVARLVVVDISPREYEPGHDALLRALESIDPARYERRTEIDDVLARDIPSFPVRQFLLKNLKREADGYRWLMNLKAIREGYDAIRGQVPAEGTFEGSTLLVRGGLSDYVDEDDVMEMRRRFPNLQVVTIPRAGHWVHAEQPALFAEAVLRFLNPEFNGVRRRTTLRGVHR